MDKPAYVSTDKTGVGKEAGAKEAMPGFEDFSSYKSTNKTEGYQQDEPPPETKQDNQDVKKASISVPNRYY